MNDLKNIFVDGVPVTERLKRHNEKVFANEHELEISRMKKLRPKLKSKTAFPLHKRIRSKYTKPSKVRHLVEMEDGKMMEKVDNPKDLTTGEAVFEAFKLVGAGRKLKVKEVSSISGKPNSGVANVLWLMSEAGVLSSGKADHKRNHYWAMEDIIDKGREFFVSELRKQQSSLKRAAKKKPKVADAKEKAKAKDVVEPTLLDGNRSKCADKIRANIERLNNNLETAHLLELKVEIEVFEAENGRNKLISRTYLEY